MSATVNLTQETQDLIMSAGPFAINSLGPFGLMFTRIGEHHFRLSIVSANGKDLGTLGDLSYWIPQDCSLTITNVSDIFNITVSK